jgi:hypothetical protein
MGGGAIILAVLLAGGVGSPAHAQDLAPDREALAQFARAHLLINDARDAFHGEIARVHDEEGRRRAREEVDARINGILEDHAITREQYDALILRISMDGELRTTFEEILAEVAEEPQS